MFFNIFCFNLKFGYIAFTSGVNYCTERVCLSVRVHISNLYVQVSQNFLYKLHTAVARSSSADGEMRYVLPVLWMTSRFHIMGNQQLTS